MSSDLDIVRLHWPSDARAALSALFAIDSAMGDVLRTTSEPMVGAIRLAWWRERLDELGQAGQAPAEPRLQAAVSALLPRGVSGKSLAGLESGWAAMLTPFPWEVAVAEAIWLRGRLLFGLGARVLGTADAAVEEAGGLWALIDAARQCSDAAAREMLVDRARTIAPHLSGQRLARRMRPLSMLGALAARDIARWPTIEPEGARGRALAIVGHRMSGRIRGHS